MRLMSAQWPGQRPSDVREASGECLQGVSTVVGVDLLEPDEAVVDSVSYSHQHALLAQTH